tara:strand:- start:1470 stop:1715 length:246 start_codon:yes stop_codon:yes gene_type:complete
MPLNSPVLELFLEDWEFNMNESDVKRKIARVVIAGRKSLDPSFKMYWKNTAKTLATKYDVNLSEIEKCPEFYNGSKVSSMH